MFQKHVHFSLDTIKVMYAMFFNTYFSGTAGYFLPRGKRNCHECNSLTIHKLVKSEHKQLDKHRIKVCYTARKTSAFEKKTCKTWTLPFKKTQKIFFKLCDTSKLQEFLRKQTF